MYMYIYVHVYVYIYIYISEIPSILNSDMCIHTHTWRQRQRQLCLLQFTVSALVQCGGVTKPVEATEATDALCAVSALVQWGGVTKPVEATEATDALSALVYCVCFSLLCLL